MTAKTVDIHISCIAIRSITSIFTLSITYTGIHITNPSLVHPFLNGKVEYGFFFTIINTSNTGIVRLTVISANLFHHIGRQVLQTGLYITAKEFLTIHQQLGNGLTIQLHITIIIHFCTWNLTYQFFQCSTFGSTISRCIVTQSITRYSYRRSFGSNHRFTQHHRICTQSNFSYIYCGFGRSKLHFLHIRSIAYKRNFQHIFTRTGFKTESTVVVCHITRRHCTVGQRK